MINKRILIIELNQKNFNVLEELFAKEGYKSHAVIDTESFNNLTLKSEDLSLIIVNAHVEYATVQEVLKCAEINATLHLPVIYVDSAKEPDNKRLAEYFKAGVNDYIKKPFNSQEIIARVKYHSEEFCKLYEYKIRVDKLGNLATIDQLSKTTSKMQMQAVLKHQINYCKRYTTKATVMYLRLLSIDKFIGTFGLPSGEKVISKFAKELKASIRDADMISRWGGADFVILLPNTAVKSAEVISKKLKAKLSNMTIMNGANPELAFGVSELQNDDDPQEVISRVQYALSEAKKQTYGKIAIA